MGGADEEESGVVVVPSLEELKKGPQTTVVDNSSDRLILGKP